MKTVTHSRPVSAGRDPELLQWIRARLQQMIKTQWPPFQAVISLSSIFVLVYRVRVIIYTGCITCHEEMSVYICNLVNVSFSLSAHVLVHACVLHFSYHPILMQKLGQVCHPCVILALCLCSLLDISGHYMMLWPPPTLSCAALRAWTLKLQRRQGGMLVLWEWLWENVIWCWLLCKSPPHTVNHSAAAWLVLCSSQVPGGGWVISRFTRRAEQGDVWATRDAVQSLLHHRHTETGYLKLSCPRRRTGVKL